MGKNKYILAGLAAGAYAYLRKKENRDKAVEAFNSTKAKVEEFIAQQKETMSNKVDEVKNTDSSETNDSSKGDVTAIPDSDMAYYIEEKEMVDEGALTTVQYFNDEVQEEVTEKENLDYYIEEKEMVDEGALTKVSYENAASQEHTNKQEAYHLNEKDMVGEGALTTVQYQNEEQHDEHHKKD